MVDLSEDVEVNVAAEAADHFIKTYYAALNSPEKRSTLASFYIKPTSTSPLKADISMNGNLLADPTELQAIFEKQVTKALYDVTSFDCHTVNTNYNIGANEKDLNPDRNGKKISILVIISGSVRYWQGVIGGDTRGFTENIVLVPNWEAHGPKAAKNERRWLIQSQTFSPTGYDPLYKILHRTLCVFQVDGGNAEDITVLTRYGGEGLGAGLRSLVCQYMATNLSASSFNHGFMDLLVDVGQIVQDFLSTTCRG